MTVNVLEKNDERPICTPHTSFMAIPVDLKVGTNIQNFKLTCTDLDSSPSSFRYTIGPGNVLDVNRSGSDSWVGALVAVERDVVR